jgi:hypothetical protein
MRRDAALFMVVVGRENESMERRKEKAKKAKEEQAVRGQTNRGTDTCAIHREERGRERERDREERERRESLFSQTFYFPALFQ